VRTTVRSLRRTQKNRRLVQRNFLSASAVSGELSAKASWGSICLEQEVAEETERAAFWFSESAPLSLFSPVQFGFCRRGTIFFLMMGRYSIRFGPRCRCKSLAGAKLADEGGPLFAGFRPGGGPLFTWRGTKVNCSSDSPARADRKNNWCGEE
jgi:hypothetical protein